MKRYEYQILQYRHDIVTSEFVNVGVVLYSQEQNFLKIKVLNKYMRISNFFADADGQYIKNKLKEVAEAIKNIEREGHLFYAQFAHIKDITSKVLNVDDGSLYFSPPKQGIDVSLELALEDTFERMVNKHHGLNSSYASDEKVWKEVYKKYFDELGITSQLTTHTIETKTDIFEFEKAWKNGIWNIYEPIGFDLADNTTIKNKVYKWFGKLNELSQITEPTQIFFLANMPQDHTLKQFIEQKLLIDFENLHIKIIDAPQAFDFAKAQKEKMSLQNA